MKHIHYSWLLVAVLMTTPAVAQNAKNDPTGKSDLGVDISEAGKTATENQAFLQKQPEADQTKIKKFCLVAVGKPDEHSIPVMTFCKNVSAM